MLLQSGRNSMLDGLRRMRCPPHGHGYDIIQLRYYSANLRNDSFTFSHFVKSKERLAKGTLQTLMPQAVEQVPTKREEKACSISYIWAEKLTWGTCGHHFLACHIQKVHLVSCRPWTWSSTVMAGPKPSTRARTSTGWIQLMATELHCVCLGGGLMTEFISQSVYYRFTVLPQGPLDAIWLVTWNGIWQAPGLQFFGAASHQLPISACLRKFQCPGRTKWGTELLILMGVPMHRMSSDCCSQHVPRWQFSFAMVTAWSYSIFMDLVMWMPAQ